MAGRDSQRESSLSTPTSFFMLTLPVIFLVLYELCQLCSSCLVLGILVWLLWGKGLSGPHPLRGNVWQEKPLEEAAKSVPFLASCQEHPGLIQPQPQGLQGGWEVIQMGIYRINRFSAHLLPSPPTPACLPHPEPHAWSQTSQDVAAAPGK